MASMSPGFHADIGLNDVSTLFSRIRPAPSAHDNPPHYQEIQRQQAAAAVSSRWPLLDELQEAGALADNHQDRRRAR